MELIRIAETSDGTFGVLTWNTKPFAVSLEDRWRENRVGRSCIPSGLYSCERVQSPKFGETFEITNVPGRSHILFHAGNTHEDTEGCVLVAEQYGQLNGQDAVLRSRPGFDEFLRLIENTYRFNLKIRKVY